jgi:hypothetical protein
MGKKAVTNTDAARYAGKAVTEIFPTPAKLTPHDCALVVGQQLYGIGRRVVKWYEPGGFNGYITDEVRIQEEDRKTGEVHERVLRGPRYTKSTSGLSSQIVIHHSGGDGPTPAQMYRTLWYDRGLSVQFACEDTGVLYQFLDAQEIAWHAGAANRMSIGVEAALFPDRAARPDYYFQPAKRGNYTHLWTHQVIQGVEREVFVMPPPQVEALAVLCAGFWAVQELRIQATRSPLSTFREAPRFPRVRGEIPSGVVASALSHTGLLGHFHLSKHKWDPAGLELATFEDEVAQLWAQRFGESKRSP